MSSGARWLVFGGEGQLGLAFGRARPTSRRPGRGAVDVTDPVAVADALAATSPDVVLQAAAWTAVDAAEAAPEAAGAVNVGGAEVVASACARAGVPLVHVSTDFVFGGGGPGPFDEHDPVAPVGVYGQTKADGEARVRASGAVVAVVRTAWVIGPDRPGFASAILGRAARGEPLRVVADQWGNPTPVDPLARGLATLGEALVDDPGLAGTWHLAGAPATTWHGLATALVAAAGLDVAVAPIPSSAWPTPAPRARDTRLRVDRVRAALGLSIDWRSSLDPVVRGWT